MTVSITDCADSFVADGLGTSRGIGFPMMEADHLFVTVNGIEQVFGADFIISGDWRGGSAVLHQVNAWPAGAVVRYERRTPPLSEFSGTPGVALPIKAVEAELDRHAMIAQEGASGFSRALKVAIGDEAPELPPLDALKGKVLGFDAGGDVVAVAVGGVSDPSLRADIAEDDGPRHIGFSHSVPGGAGTMLRKAQQLVAVTDRPFDATGVGDESVKVAAALSHVAGKPLLIPGGVQVKANSYDNPMSQIVGSGKLVRDGAWGGLEQLNTYTHTGRDVLGLVRRRRIFQRLALQTSSSTEVLSVKLFGNSTQALAARNVTGSIAGNVLTVTDVSAINGGRLIKGTSLSGGSILANTIITDFGSGTGGTGTYIVNNAQTVASMLISTWNGGGYAGLLGEPNYLLPKLWRRNGVRMGINVQSFALGGSDLGDIDFLDHLDTVTGADDVMICGHGINDAPDLALFFDRYRTKLDRLRGNPYGTVQNLCFCAVGPQATADVEHGRSDYWMEDLRGGFENLVNDYDIVFVDGFALTRGVGWGTGTLLDDAFGTGHSGVHARLDLQTWLWTRVGEALIPAHDMLFYDDNSFQPVAYPAGWSSASGLGYNTPYWTMNRDGWLRFGGVVQGPAALAGAAIAQSPLWGPIADIEPVLVASSQGPIPVRWNKENRNIELHANFSSAGWISLKGVEGATR